MVIESFSEKKWFSSQGMACAVYEERKGGFPLRGRSREWLTLLAAVECSMSSLAKPLREKPPTIYHSLFAIRHFPFAIRYLLFAIYQKRRFYGKDLL
ncbi:MAG: hypothetical protein DRI36_04015 [Caldiserica bacterium]|nr:MAG: hypothetical protein DRI36_04015 [Caldisericota bacterium]